MAILKVKNFRHTGGIATFVIPRDVSADIEDVEIEDVMFGLVQGISPADLSSLTSAIKGFPDETAELRAELRAIPEDRPAEREKAIRNSKLSAALTDFASLVTVVEFLKNLL